MSATTTSILPETPDGKVFDNDNTMSRTVLVQISGTPASFDSLGGDHGCWRVTPEQAAKIFSKDPKMPLEHCLKEIKNSLLKKITLLEYKTNAPDVCGIYIDGLPGNEFTQSGDGHHCFLIGNTHSSSEIPIFVASGDTELGLNWMRNYPEYTKENIRSHQVMRLNGSTYYFVHEEHPVINLLYHNQDSLGTKIDESDKVNGNWYRIDLQVFDDSCHTLDTEVFSKTPQVFDLSNLCVRLKRPDNRRWLDTPLFLDGMSTADPLEKQRLYKKFTDTPIHVVARMKVEYSAS